ncbi:MAG TPA: LapA family protein [Pseudolabrys sp.]|nr:LapA family protein [Pseudolabrys sp.]
MFRKIVTAIIVVPLAAVIIAFAVANRQTVTVSFDPFSSANPAYAATLPLFAAIFAVLILGVIVGGIAAWIRQSKWRRAARRLDGEVRALHDEMDAVRRRFAASEKPSPAAPSPLAAIPPPMP